MEYTEIAVTVAAGDAERAADVLRAATGRDVWSETPFTQPDLEHDAVPDAGAPVVVHGYARDADEAERARGGLARAGIVGPIATRTVAEEDWAECWKQYFDVERYGEHIVVVPTWRTYEPQADDVVIALDPGMAFGTGQHETTRMCLEALERAVVPGARVLDVGCGSGILSITAAKLGAREAVALDVDPDCVRVTDGNAALNAVGDVVRAHAGSLGAQWPLTEPARAFDVVVANIVAGAIIDMAQQLVDALAPDGVLIASGIIGERERQTRDALEGAGARVESVGAMADWRCMEARRSAARTP